MYPEQSNNPNPIVQGNFSEAPITDAPEGANGRKKGIFIAGLVVIVLLLLGAIFYFITQSPTSPNKLWPTALTNSSSASNAVLYYMGNPASNGYDVSGAFETKSTGTTTSDVKGTTTGSLNGQASTYTTKFPVQGNPISIDTVTNTPDGASSPDIYYRVSGLSAVSQIFEQNNGSSSFTDSAGQVEGIWFLLSHTDPSSAATASELNQSLPQPLAQVGTLSTKLNTLNEQYLFGTDPSKAILTNRQNVGAVTVNKRAEYHYKFSFQVANYKNYLAAVTAAVGSDSQALTSLEQQLGISSLNTALSSVKGNPTADVYVDKGTKTISTIHIPVAAGADNYVETGFSGYTGGSVYPFSVTLHANANNVTTVNNYSLNINTKGGFTYAYSQSNKNAQGTQASTGTTTISPRKSSLVIDLPTQTSDFQANATALSNVFAGLFPGSQN